MKSKFFFTTALVLMLLLVFASQVFAADANNDPQRSLLLTRALTSTRTPTKKPIKTITRTPTKTATSLPSVTGAVLIHGGGCCMGGPVGTTISIDTAFSATSTAGAVTQMRIAHLACNTTLDLSSAAWEPYVASKSFSYNIVALNWVSYYVDVQYRDGAGNLSPVYCDDISIEGMPAGGTTVTPTVVITSTKTPSPTVTSIPGADFSGTPLSGAAPLTVQFTALNSSVLSSCTWTFGDGTSQSFSGSFSVCPSTTHIYTAAGSYNVSLSVLKVTGASNSMTKTNYIQVTGSSATLTPTPTKTRTSTPTPSKTLVITGT